MMLPADDLDEWRREKEDLERQELQSTLCPTSAETYTKLLLLYLIDQEEYVVAAAPFLIGNVMISFCRMLAKFLWKRVPESLKEEESELSLAWQLGQAFIRRDSDAAHKVLKSEKWSEDIKKYVKKLTGQCGCKQQSTKSLEDWPPFLPELSRQRCLVEIGHSYTSIRVSDLSARLGLTEDETKSLAEQQPGWTVEVEMVMPQQIASHTDKEPPSEERLRQLTDYITFLEK